MHFRYFDPARPNLTGPDPRVNPTRVQPCAVLAMIDCVCPSVTHWHCVKMTCYNHAVLLEDSPMTLVSSRLTSARNSKGNIGSESADYLCNDVNFCYNHFNDLSFLTVCLLLRWHAMHEFVRCWCWSTWTHRSNGLTAMSCGEVRLLSWSTFHALTITDDCMTPIILYSPSVQ